MKLPKLFTDNLFFVFLFWMYFSLLSTLLLLVTRLFFPTVQFFILSFAPVSSASVLGVTLVAYFLSKLHAGVQEESPFHNCVEEMLENKITRFVTELRQPLSDIKQIAYFTPHMTDVEEGRKRIIAASEEALDMVKRFELESTGRTLVEPSSHLVQVMAEN
jgi:hypothetical protein